MENTLEFPGFGENEVFLTEDGLETPVVENVDEPQDPELETPPAEEPAVDPLAQVTYETLVEKGLFTNDDEFDGTFDSIEAKMSELPTKLLNQAIEDLPDYSKPVLKFIATAGHNLTQDELKDFMREYLGEQDVPDLSTADTARSFLEEHLKSQGLRPNAIQAQLDDLEDSDELVTEAKKLFEAKEKKTQTLIEQKTESNAAIEEANKKFFTSVQETLAATNWAKPQQDKVLQTIPKTNSIFNEIAKIPLAYVQMMDFLSKFDGKQFDLESYRKQGESRAASAIKEKIEKSGFTSASKTKTTTETPSTESGFKDYKLII